MTVKLRNGDLKTLCMRKGLVTCGPRFSPCVVDILLHSWCPFFSAGRYQYKRLQVLIMYSPSHLTMQFLPCTWHIHLEMVS